MTTENIKKNDRSVSVIIPAYNVESFVETALKSVVAQGEVVKECIIIDDGSTDNTPAVVSNFISSHAEYPCNFRLVSVSNAGVSAARNMALEMATADWLTFLDADDALLSGALDHLLVVAKNSDAGIVEGKIIESAFPPDLLNKTAKSLGGADVEVLTGLQAAEKSLYQNGINSSLYAKIYHRALWESVRMPVGEIYEDLSVFYKVAMRTDRYVRTSFPTYFYRLRPQSQIHTFSPKRLIVLDVTRRICDDFQRRISLGDSAGNEIKNRELLKAATDRRLAANFNMLGLLLNNDAENREEVMGECREFIKLHSAATLFNRKARLKNRVGAMAALILPRPVLDALLRRLYR